MNNIKAGLFYSRIFAQSERVLCCLALQKQVLIASNNSIEGLDLHSFMFSEHIKLKMSGNAIEQLGILLYLFYLHIKNKHKVQKSCDFFSLDLAQGKMYMILIKI